MALAFDLQLSAKGVLTLDSGISIPAEPIGVGQGDFDAIEMTLSDGDGDSEAENWIAESVVLPTASVLTVDLTNVGNNLGQTVDFDKVKFVLVRVLYPDGIKHVKLGPNGDADGWLGWFGEDGTAECNQAYEKVYDWVCHPHRWGGWEVENAGTSGGKNLRIENQSGFSLTVQYWVIGTNR